jgi:hypothetical protein
MTSSIQDRCSLLVTPRFEYLICDSICYGVRDRKSGEWFDPHYALGNTVSLVPSATRFAGSRWDVQVETSGSDVVVGPLLALEKPAVEVCSRVERRKVVRGAA